MRLSLLLLLVSFFSAHGSELTRGKKALFTEDFEADIYEWEVTEEGETEEETPKLVRRDDAYQGNNVLLLSGKQGMIALSLTRKIKGIVEFQATFPSPLVTTRMFAVGLGDETLALGVSRSDRFMALAEGEMGGGQWIESGVKVTDGWHTFTYDFSGAITRLYVDGQLILVNEKLGEFDRLQLGIHQGHGGTCLVDEVVVYDAAAEFSEENSIEATIPLLDWDHGLKPATQREQMYEDATYTITDAEVRSPPNAAELVLEPMPESRWRFCHFQRKPELPGLPRRLSLWVHGDGSGAEFHIQFLTPNSNVNYDMGRIDWAGWKQLELDLTKQSTGFYPPAKPHVIRHAGSEGGMLLSWWLRPPPNTPVRIYIDDVHVTSRLNRDFPYVFHVESTAEDGVMELGEYAEFRVRVANGGDTKRDFSIDYTVEDFWGTVVRRGDTKLSAGPGDASVAAIRVDDPLPSGWFKARFLLGIDEKTVTTAVEPVAVLRALPDRIFSPDNPVGIYGSFDRLGKKIGVTEAYVGPETGDLRHATPEQLRAWEISDENRRILGTANRTGVVFYHAPPWSYLPDEEMEAAAEEWADAFAVFAAKHKGLPLYYKILSEPNNTGTSFERCVQVLKYAHRGILKGDPDAKIMGLNTSKFDWGRQKYVWGRGALDYVYGVGVHPYTGARHGSKKPERVHGMGNLMNMLRLDDMIRRYNGGEPRPIWASEIGMDSTPGVSWGFTIREQANYLARAAVEYKTMKNFQRFHYHYIKDAQVENHHWGAFTALNQPKPLAASMHSIAERLTGVTWLKSMHTPENVRAYLFDERDSGSGTRDARQMLVAWTVEGEEDWKIPVTCSSAETMDLMGVYRTLEVPGNTLNLALTESPVFITPADGTRLADAWIQAVTRYREVIPGQEGKELTARIRNLSSKSLKGEVMAEVPEGLSLEPATQSVEVPPGGEEVLTFELSVAADCEAKNHFLILRLVGTLPDALAMTPMMISVVHPDVNLAALKVDEAPVLDGELDDPAWQDAAVTEQFAEGSGFAASRGHRLRLIYTDEALYLGARFDKAPGDVLRADHTERDDGYLWMDEGIEVFLDPNLDRANYFQFISNLNGVQSDYQYNDVHRKKREYGKAREWNGVWSVATEEADDHWIAEIRIPWSTVGVLPGATHRIGLHVSHSSGISGEPKKYSFTLGGIPNHAVEAYLPVDFDL